jgi:hypothetical protein
MDEGAHTLAQVSEGVDDTKLLVGAAQWYSRALTHDTHRLVCLAVLLMLHPAREQHLRRKGESGEVVEIWRALGQMTLAVVGSTAYG